MQIPTKAGWYWVEYNHIPGEKTMIEVTEQESGHGFKGGLGVMKEGYRGGYGEFVRVEDLEVKWLGEAKGA